MTPPIMLDAATVEAFAAARFAAGQTAGQVAGRAAGHAAGVIAGKESIKLPVTIGFLMFSGAALLLLVYMHEAHQKRLRYVIALKEAQNEAERQTAMQQGQVRQPSVYVV